MEYVIGVDAGGTKTATIAYNLKGEELTKSIKGFGNLVSGKEEALRNIVNSIENCTEVLGSEGLRGLYIGLAGVEIGNNAEVVLKEVKNKIHIQPVIMNDTNLALKAALKGEDGILTIAGTGSNCFGINGQVEAKSGGWGHLLGDEGSGYRISIEAFKRMIFESDYGLEKSRLSKAILKKLNIVEVEEILEFVYSSKKGEIAAITTLVASLAEEGDEYAVKIIKTEGVELGKTTENVYRKLGFKNGCKVGIKGSVIQKIGLLRQAFEYYLNDKIDNIAIVDNDISPAKGSYYMYKKEMFI